MPNNTSNLLLNSTVDLLFDYTGDLLLDDGGGFLVDMTSCCTALFPCAPSRSPVAAPFT